GALRRRATRLRLVAAASRICSRAAALARTAGSRVQAPPSPPTPLPEGEGRLPSPPTPLPDGERRLPSPPTPLPEGEGRLPSALAPLPEGEGKRSWTWRGCWSRLSRMRMACPPRSTR